MPNAPTTCFHPCAAVAFQMQSAAEGVAVNKDNCLKMAAAAGEVIRALDTSVRKGGAGVLPEDQAMLALTAKWSEGLATIVTYSRQGWLMHLCCNERLKEEHDGWHSSMADLAKVRCSWSGMERPDKHRN